MKKMIYLLLKDFPKLRDYLYKAKIEEFPEKIKQDIKNLRSSLIITEDVDKQNSF